MGLGSTKILKHQNGSKKRIKSTKIWIKKETPHWGRTPDPPDLVRLERLDFLCGLQELLKKTRCAKFLLFFYSQIDKSTKNVRICSLHFISICCFCLFMFHKSITRMCSILNLSNSYSSHTSRHNEENVGTSLKWNFSGTPRT